MIHLSKEQIKNTLPKIKPGLEQYLWLQDEINNRDVSKDREFQKKFNAFYKVRRNLEWQKPFYELLEINKKNNLNFKTVLIKLHQKTGRMEASFVSKLIATVDPKMPVIDKIVFKNLGLKLPPSNIKNRECLINDLYNVLLCELSKFLETQNGKYLTEQFIERYPKANITNIKKLDFVLWQIRD